MHSAVPYLKNVSVLPLGIMVCASLKIFALFDQFKCIFVFSFVQASLFIRFRFSLISCVMLFLVVVKAAVGTAVDAIDVDTTDLQFSISIVRGSNIFHFR